MNLFILFSQNGIKVHRLPSPDYVTTCSLTSPALGAKEGRTSDLVSRVTVAKVLDFLEKHCFRTSAEAAPVGCEPLRLSVKGLRRLFLPSEFMLHVWDVMTWVAVIPCIRHPIITS